jgi:hypothetical protein
MKMDIMSSLLEKHSGPAILIIYDNFFFAERANALFQDAAYQAEQPKVTLWRLDGLRLSLEADRALVEAADARLIVFAGQRTQSLPFWLENWLEKWIVCRRIKSAAFAVIGGKNGEALTLPARPELFHFTTKHGLNFVVYENLAAQGRGIFPVTGGESLYENVESTA